MAQSNKEQHRRKEPSRGDESPFWRDMSGLSQQELTVSGSKLRRGSRVRLKPRGGDILDDALIGRLAVVEEIDQDDAGTFHVTVSLEDQAWDLAGARHPSTRFFFAPDELEPVVPDDAAAQAPRVLVAGLGNVFLGDDGFGVAVVGELQGRSLPEGIDVADFGIRAMDLAYALGRHYDAAILVDAVACGSEPGSLHIIEPDTSVTDQGMSLNGHTIDPSAVLEFAQRLGELPRLFFIVGCEPETLGPVGHEEGLRVDLSERVAASVGEAVEIVIDLVSRIVSGNVPPSWEPIRKHGKEGNSS